MAKCEIEMPEEFLEALSNLGKKTDKIIGEGLEAGGEVAVIEMRKRLEAVIGNGTKRKSRSTGELLNSLGVTPAGINSIGNHNVNVGFNEPRRGGSRAELKERRRAAGRTNRKHTYYEQTNAMVANVLEYGKHGQPPRPFMNATRAAKEKECTDVVAAKIEEGIASMWVY